jgi:hypothetical protein
LLDFFGLALVVHVYLGAPYAFINKFLFTYQKCFFDTIRESDMNPIQIEWVRIEKSDPFNYIGQVGVDLIVLYLCFNMTGT